jgi:hypothetical protein
MLEGWLSWHRETLLTKCAGLESAQLARATVEPSNLTLLGLVRHMAEVERWWFRRSFAGEAIGDGCGSFGGTFFHRSQSWLLPGWGAASLPGMISPVGVMYDYFSAVSDESAATTIDLPGGPDGVGAKLPMSVPEIVRRYGRDGLREFLRPRLRLAETGVPRRGHQGVRLDD